MRYRISPLRFAVESFLNLVGLGPRRSLLTPARHPESRVRFAQYMNRVQPTRDHQHSDRRAIRFLGGGGAVTRGIIRHAPVEGQVSPVRTPAFRFANEPGHQAALRRSRAHAHHLPNPFKLLLHALRVR